MRIRSDKAPVVQRQQRPSGPSTPTPGQFVFADPSGRRWRRTRVMLCVFGVLVVAAAVPLVGHLADSPQASAHFEQHLSAQDLGPNVPVVGQGPLVRVIGVDRSSGTSVGIEPFTGATVGPLTAQESDAAGSAPYVIQRFGYAPGQTHSISLTFDDGPSAQYTPQVLDILSAAKVPATFFLTGVNIAAHPDIVQRVVREGHAAAGHSITHVDLSESGEARARFELTMPDRLLRSITNTSVGYLRLPFISDDEQELRDSLEGLLRAQRCGYAMAGQDFDPMDWYYSGHPELGTMPMPELTGQNLTVLLHDAGGTSRAETIDYLKRIIALAKEHGYTFQTMPQAQPELSGRVQHVEATMWDDLAVTTVEAMFLWPAAIMRFLFKFALVAVVALGITYAALALLGRRRHRATVFPTQDSLSVSIILAAYNEEAVIDRTLQSLCASRYPFLELIVIDDGSTDATCAVVSQWCGRDSRVRLVTQLNAGKSAALNNGLRHARGEAVFTLDADTVVTPETIGFLVRNLGADSSGRLAAVSGMIRVGNGRQNLLTRWQALEYVTQIGLERAAQSYLRAVTIIPGACAIWRREAMLRVGGFSHDTLAEDCDVSLALQRAGYWVSLDYDAIAYTEAPEDVSALLAQRTRWTYGNIQALYKHRGMLFRRRYGWLGCAVMPLLWVQVLVPILTIPLVTVMSVLLVQAQGWGVLVLFFLAFTAAHFLLSWFSVRHLKAKPSLLVMVPLYRLVFEPLRAYLLYVSVLQALRGLRTGWNKLQRTGALDGGLVDESVSPAPTAPSQRRSYEPILEMRSTT